MRVLLISPCRDEAEHLVRSAQSVLAQTCPPALWLIVDDGSRDETPALLAELATRAPWIRVLRREDRGHRRVGPGVVEAFEAGLASVALADFDVVGKLDLDLELPPAYLERLLEALRADPRLGSVSGKPWALAADGRSAPEPCGDENSAGMTKLWRRACFEELGGLVREVMWDGIDCHKARMLGWRAASLDGESLRFLHLRARGSSETSLWTGRVRHGAGQWFMGTGALYLAASALYRVTEPPVLVGSLGMLWGWTRCALRRAPRYAEPGFRAFLRRWQREALLLGKRRATARAEARGLAARRQPFPEDSRASAAAPPAPPVPSGHEHARAAPAPRGQEPARAPRVELLGVAVDALDEAGCVERVCSALRAGRGGWIVTPNLDHLRRLVRDAEFRALCAGADLAVADGMPLVWAARLQGTPLPERVAGSNLVWSLAAAAAGEQRSLFLLGGDPGTAEATARVLRARHPTLALAGLEVPEPGFERDPARLAALRASLVASRADLVLVALGSPKQERLIASLREALPRAWWIGVGIGFSFASGRVKRAPRWLQALGLEWLHRLAQEPRRLARRYLVDGLPFAARLLARSAWRGLRTSGR